MYGKDISTSVKLDSDIYNPVYEHKEEFREPSIPPSATLLLKVCCHGDGGHGDFIFNASLVPCAKFRPSYLGKATAAARAVLPISASVCSILFVVRHWYGCQCWVFFNVCTDVDACNCARGLYSVRESALEVACGRKMHCRTGE